MGQINFWDLSYVLYILGFFLFPRITVIIIFKNYVTHAFNWEIFLVGITIWWKFPILGLGFWAKAFFMFSFATFPRLLLGVIGYKYLSPDNHIIMIFICVLGVIIDLVVNILRRNYNR